MKLHSDLSADERDAANLKVVKDGPVKDRLSEKPGGQHPVCDNAPITSTPKTNHITYA